jgi:hypothetical protein
MFFIVKPVITVDEVTGVIDHSRFTHATGTTTA